MKIPFSLLLLILCFVSGCKGAGSDDSGQFDEYKGQIVTTRSPYEPGTQYYGKTLAFTNAEDLTKWTRFNVDGRVNSPEAMEWFRVRGMEAMVMINSGSSMQVDEVVAGGYMTIARMAGADGQFESRRLYLTSDNLYTSEGTSILDETAQLR